MSSEITATTFNFSVEATKDDSLSPQLPDFTPRSFATYIGQPELKKKLEIYSQAALLRGQPLDHTLLSGPPGLGKTTLAHILASHMQVGIKICSGPMLERTGDLVAILTSLQARDIFFIDEIHRMPICIKIE